MKIFVIDFGFYVNVLLQVVYLQIKSRCLLSNRKNSFLKITRIESEHVLNKCRNA